MDKTQISKAVYSLIGNKYVTWLNIHAQVSASPADRKCSAQIEADIQRIQMG